VPGFARALRKRNYRLFFGGQLVSLVGTWMQAIAQSWLVYRLTKSELLLGLVGFSSQFPVFLFGPLGGVVADRVHRRRVLIFTQTSAMLLAFVLSALTLWGEVRVYQVFMLAALLGVVNAFDIPARQTFVVDMVGKEDLVNAIALNSSMVNGARIVGPALAGIVVAAVGEGWCFFANGVSYVGVIAGLIAMTNLPPARTKSGRSARSELAEGFRFVATTPPIRALLLMLGLVSLMGMPYVVLMPVFADRILHGDARTLGLLTGSSGLGALIGALSLAGRKGIQGLGRWVAIAGAGFGASLCAFAVSRSIWLSVATLLPVGFAMMVQMAGTNTLIQTMSPDAMRGRIMAAYTMMFMGMGPFGALLAGALAQRIGAPWTVAVGGIACMVGAAIFALRLPTLRAAARALAEAKA
jgi:MFS family permease